MIKQAYEYGLMDEFEKIADILGSVIKQPFKSNMFAGGRPGMLKFKRDMAPLVDLKKTNPNIDRSTAHAIKHEYRDPSFNTRESIVKMKNQFQEEANRKKFSKPGVPDAVKRIHAAVQERLAQSSRWAKEDLPQFMRSVKI